jgi:predicted enzyme related to lactoylglutathione lyase
VSDTNTTPPVRFGFVKFVVRDLPLMRNFYERAIGLAVDKVVDTPELTEVVMKIPGMAAGGTSLILYWNKDGREIIVGNGHGPLGLYVADVDAAYARAVSQGATTDRAPFEAVGMRFAFIVDPEGHEIEFLSQAG